MLTAADITPEDWALLEKVRPGSHAAFAARQRWIEQAQKRAAELGQPTVKQILPEKGWTRAIIRAGRFFGKTRTGVEWAWWECFRMPGIRLHVLSPTLGDVRRTLFEGESGFIAKVPPEVIRTYSKTDKEIHFKNGSMIAGFSMVEEADRLRGPQCHEMLIDEAAAADRPAGNFESAYRVAALGCRLPCPDGTPSRILITTTPRPIPFMKRLEARDGTIVIRGSSYENVRNVSDEAMKEVLALEGTAYGRQEIHGDYIDESDQSILKRPWFRLWPADRPLPEFSFLIESYDTAASEENYDRKKQTTDPTACIVLGIFNVKQVFTTDEQKRFGVRQRYAALLCEAWSERMGFPDLLDKARAQRRTLWGPKGKQRRADITLIEDKSSGRQLRQVMATWGVPCWPYNPVQSKTQRMHMVSPFIKQGAIFVPESGLPERKGLVRDWVEPFLEQVCTYSGPTSVEHDDFCDALTGGVIYLRDRNMLEATPDVLDLDPDEKVEREQREALKQLSVSSEARSYYGS